MNSRILARISIVFFGLYFICFPMSAAASKCNSVVRQVSTDVLKYSDTLQNQSLIWMNVGWLQQALGKTYMTRLSDTENGYLWHCPENRAIHLSVAVDGRGRITNVSGVYSSIKGARMFSAALDKEPVTVVNPQAGQPVAN